MTQEEKQLLLQDLCSRLPYGTKVKCPSDDEPYTLLSINWNKEIAVIGFMVDKMYATCKQKLVDVKPYLRPLSSMTEEEKVEYTSYCFEQPFLQKDKTPNLGSVPMCIDWLNAHYFDYRGLIQKGLAISTEEFNPYKD